MKIVKEIFWTYSQELTMPFKTALLFISKVSMMLQAAPEIVSLRNFPNSQPMSNSISK